MSESNPRHPTPSPTPPPDRRDPRRSRPRSSRPGRRAPRTEIIQVAEEQEESAGERLEREAKRGAPGLVGSLLLHALLLLVMGLIVMGHDRFGGESTLEFGWISPEEMKASRTARGPIRLPGIENSTAKSPEKEPDAEPKQNDTSGGPPQLPAKPVTVVGMLEGRTPARRTALLEQAGGNKKTEQTISQALAWLSRQQLGGGNWQLHQGYPDPSEPSIRTDAGATALALLAFLGAGHTHRQGEYQPQVAAGLKWLTDHQDRTGQGDEFDGNFHDIDEYGRRTTYYAHAQATTAICEAFALTGDESLRKPAERAVAFLLRSQHPEFGGWRYMPLKERNVGDLSVTGWVLMALHTARACGIEVSADDFYRASLFLDSVQLRGGSRYKNMQRDPAETVTPGLTAEGLLARQYFGWPADHPPMQEGIRWLLEDENRPTWEGKSCDVDAWYFEAQVLHQMGGDEWRAWYAEVQRMIVDKQVAFGRPDVRGSWKPDCVSGSPLFYESAAGRLHFTAMCALVLETPLRHARIAAYRTP